jgi:hypothetical protein
MTPNLPWADVHAMAIQNARELARHPGTQLLKQDTKSRIHLMLLV